MNAAPKFTQNFNLTQDGFTTCVETDAGAHCFRIDKAVGAELCMRANAAPLLYERIECAAFLLADVLAMIPATSGAEVRKRIERELADCRAALAKADA